MDKQKISLEEQFNDYEKTPVPVEARRNWYEQGMIWLGEGFGSASGHRRRACMQHCP